MAELVVYKDGTTRTEIKIKQLDAEGVRHDDLYSGYTNLDRFNTDRFRWAEIPESPFE